MREMVNLESLKDGFGGDEIALLIRLEPGPWTLEVAACHEGGLLTMVVW